MKNKGISNKKILEYLKILDRKDYCTAIELAEHFAISERTARTRIKRVKELIEGNGALIESRPHYGYKLIVENKLLFDRFEAHIKKERSMAPETNEDIAIESILLLLLKQNYYTIDSLCEHFYINRVTLANSLKMIESSIEKYGLKIERRQKYGLRIQGNQFDIRLCAAHLIRKTYFFCTKEDLDILAASIKNILDKYMIEMADAAFNHLLSALYVMMLEVIYGNTYIETAHRKVNDKAFDDSIQKGAKDIRQALEEKFDIGIPIGEELYIAIHLAGRRYLNDGISTAWNNVIPSEIMIMVDEMIEVVKVVFAIDFSNNFDLQVMLSQHMMPLMIRIQYGMQSENPMLESIKTNYSYAFNMAVQSSVVIEKHTGKEVTEDEVAYIATLFALAIKQGSRHIDKKNIVLICATGISSCKLLEFELQQRYGDYIDKIILSNKSSLKSMDLAGVDYVFTTVPILEKIDKPIIEVKAIMADEKFMDLGNMLTNPSIKDLSNFYAPDLFYIDVEGKNKEEVIHFICEQMKKTRDLPSDFEEMVLKREKLSTTDFGNKIAMPHPIKRVRNTTIAVAILKEPILWNRHQVQMVFLISLAEDVEEETQLFWKRTSAFMMRKDLVEAVIEKPIYENFMSLLSMMSLED